MEKYPPNEWAEQFCADWQDRTASEGFRHLTSQDKALVGAVLEWAYRYGKITVVTPEDESSE